MNWKHLEHCEVEKCNKERPELLKPHIKQKEVMQHNGKRPSALNVFWNILALNLKEVYCIVSTFDILPCWCTHCIEHVNFCGPGL